MTEIDNQELVADLHGQMVGLRMGEREEFIEQAELVHQLKGRRVYSIAAEIADEVSVLFQHCDINACTRKQKAEHHSGRTAADDAAFRGD